MIRSLVTQMLDVLESTTYNGPKMGRAITAAREYLATEPSGERAELIAQLRDAHGRRFDTSPSPYSRAADMLEADAQQSKPDIKDLQANGKGPAPCARFCEANAFEIEIRRLTAKLNAQQAKRVPMTDAEAHQTLLDMAANIEKFGDGTESNEQLSSECIRFILERVDHHGITQANKPTGWDNGLSQDYCAEFGKWLASRPGARQQIKEMFDEPEEEDLYALALKADNWGQP